MLRNETAVDAVELFDRASLRECEADENMTRLVRDLVVCAVLLLSKQLLENLPRERGVHPLFSPLLTSC